MPSTNNLNDDSAYAELMQQLTAAWTIDDGIEKTGAGLNDDEIEFRADLLRQIRDEIEDDEEDMEPEVKEAMLRTMLCRKAASQTRTAWNVIKAEVEHVYINGTWRFVPVPDENGELVLPSSDDPRAGFGAWYRYTFADVLKRDENRFYTIQKLAMLAGKLDTLGISRDEFDALDQSKQAILSAHLDNTIKNGNDQHKAKLQAIVRGGSKLTNAQIRDELVKAGMMEKRRARVENEVELAGKAGIVFNVTALENGMKILWIADDETRIAAYTAALRLTTMEATEIDLEDAIE